MFCRNKKNVTRRKGHGVKCVCVCRGELAETGEVRAGEKAKLLIRARLNACLGSHFPCLSSTGVGGLGVGAV